MLDNAGREISIGDFIRSGPPSAENYYSGFKGIAKAVAFTDEDEVELEKISSPELGIYPGSCLISYATVAEAADAEKKANAAELPEALKQQDAIYSPMTTGERRARLGGLMIGFVLGLMAPAVWQAMIVPIGGYVLWGLFLLHSWIKWPFAYILPADWATIIAVFAELYLLVGVIFCGKIVFDRARQSVGMLRALAEIAKVGIVVLMLGGIGLVLIAWAVYLWNAVSS